MESILLTRFSKNWHTSTLRCRGKLHKILMRSKKVTLKYSFKRRRKEIGRADPWWLIANRWSSIQFVVPWLPKTYMVLTISVFNNKVSAHYSQKLAMNLPIYWKRREIRFVYWSKNAIPFTASSFPLAFQEGQGQVSHFYWRNFRNKITNLRFLWHRTHSRMSAQVFTA